MVPSRASSTSVRSSGRRRVVDRCRVPDDGRASSTRWSLRPDDPINRTRFFYEVVDAVVASVRAGRVRDVLQRVFQPARPLTPLHRALARLSKAGPFAAIVTTNYDDLMERALAAEAAPFPYAKGSGIACAICVTWKLTFICCAAIDDR